MIKQILNTAVSVCMISFLGMVFYAACGDNGTSSTPSFDTCERPPKYRTQDELELHEILKFEDWLSQTGTVLTSEQTDRLNQTGDLVGVFTAELTKPVKFPNGLIDMPAAYLPSLPNGHPWNDPMTADNTGSFPKTFPAYFEVRVVDPFLLDLDRYDHVEWSEAYLTVVNELYNTQDNPLIMSFVVGDSSCQ